MLALGWSCMGMLGLTLLSHTVDSTTLNKWLRRVCKQGFLVIRALCSLDFLGGTLVRALESVIGKKALMAVRQAANIKQ